MQMQIGIPNVDINGSKNRRRNLGTAGGGAGGVKSGHGFTYT